MTGPKRLLDQDDESDLPDDLRESIEDTPTDGGKEAFRFYDCDDKPIEPVRHAARRRGAMPDQSHTGPRELRQQD